MKKYFLILIVLLAASTAHATVTWTYIGGTGTNGVGVNFLITSSYNIVAHHCIVAFTNSYNQAPGTITDHGGDTPTRVISNTVGTNSNNHTAWVFYNVAADAANTINVTFSNANFATLTAWDVDPGGNCTSGLLDSSGTGSATTVSSGTSISKTISTSTTTSATMTAVYQDSASMTAATPPTSFTGQTIVASYARGAANSWSSPQTSLSLSWTSVAATAGLDMDVVTIDQVSGGAAVCAPSVTSLGAGQC